MFCFLFIDIENVKRELREKVLLQRVYRRKEWATAQEQENVRNEKHKGQSMAKGDCGVNKNKITRNFKLNYKYPHTTKINNNLKHQKRILNLIKPKPKTWIKNCLWIKSLKYMCEMTHIYIS